MPLTVGPYLQPGRKYGLPSNHPFLKTWRGMCSRCTNPKDKDYAKYSQRGLDPAWLDFDQFYVDMWPTWKPGLTLDRRKNELGYSKANCRWATSAEQAQNRNSTKVTPEIVKSVRESFLSIKELAEQFNLAERTIRHLKAGTRWTNCL